MSTTFQTIAVETVDITFGQVIDLSEKYINDFLKSIDIEKTIKLNVNIHNNSEKYVVQVKPTDKFEWRESEYAWFSVEGVPGGTDVYCEQLKDIYYSSENPWAFIEEMDLSNITPEYPNETIEKAKALNRLWRFRRSAGQPAIIVLSYGIISAAVAELTGGFVWSGDGAWEHKMFPAKSADFIDWYFRPEKTEEPGCKSWAENCIKGMRREMNESYFTC